MTILQISFLSDKLLQGRMDYSKPLQEIVLTLQRLPGWMYSQELTFIRQQIQQARSVPQPGATSDPEQHPTLSTHRAVNRPPSPNWIDEQWWSLLWHASLGITSLSAEVVDLTLDDFRRKALMKYGQSV